MVHFILGTEAELIKMFPIMLELKKRKIDYNFIGTGQHDLEKSEILKLFGLKKPDRMLSRNNLFTSIAKMFIWFFRIILKYRNKKTNIFRNDKNGLVFVHGDALSTLMGAILAKSHGMKLAHVEAGVRSRSILHPFPEEIDRRIVSTLTDYHFCPGDLYVHNLRNYKKSKRINIRYNTALDAVARVRPVFNKLKLSALKIPEKYFIFIMHRTEHLINRSLVTRMVQLLLEKAKTLKAVFITHHTTEHALKKFGLYDSVRKNPNIVIIPRQSFSKFMKILWNAEFIVSDGGGNQQECSYLGIPNLILRKAVEGPEGVGHNAVVSRLNLKIIGDFFNHYSDYRKKRNDFKVSPSGIVIKTLLRNNLMCASDNRPIRAARKRTLGKHI